MSGKKTGGHYARVMGTLHRHTKTEKAGDAAMGMLVRIWSYCADMGRHVLSERDMAVIMVRDRNGPRKLRALLDEKFLEKVEGGYTPHNWFVHNPGIKPSDYSESPLPESGTRVDGEDNATLNATGKATQNVSKPPKRNQVVTPPPSDSGLRTQELLREAQSASAYSLPAGQDPGVQLAMLVHRRFRKLYLGSFSADPAMGGKNVGDFHNRLANTAEARGEDPLALLEQVFELWADAGRPGLNKASPFSAFVARFDELLEEIQPPTQPEPERAFF